MKTAYCHLELTLLVSPPLPHSSPPTRHLLMSVLLLALLPPSLPPPLLLSTAQGEACFRLRLDSPKAVVYMYEGEEIVLFSHSSKCQMGNDPHDNQNRTHMSMYFDLHELSLK